MAMENLSFDTVIIVACVCGGVVLILSIILIVLCCQRRRSKDLYEKTETNVIEPSTRPSDMDSTRQPQHQDDHSRPCQSTEDCADDDARTSYRSSKPTLATTANYASSSHIVSGDIGSSTLEASVSQVAASAADDKRPRKVIYEVIV